VRTTTISIIHFKIVTQQKIYKAILIVNFMSKIETFDKSKVIVGVQFPIEITSIERYQQILNNPDFQKQYGIEKMFFVQGEIFKANLDSVYIGRDHRHGINFTRCFKNTGSEDELLSEEPIAVAYTDGGLEYLSGFLGQATDHPSYRNELIMPNNSKLIFHHPIKDKKLVELITGM